MTEVPQIIDLEKIVEPHLNGGKLISYTSRYLTKPGENYGSIMLAITTNVERADGQIEELPLIAKLPPLTNDLYWSIFQPERTCITENAVYQYLGPAIIEMQLEAGITEENLFDCLPRYYGSRISLSREATKVDRDAVLVQENLQTSGYKPGNRNKMYDLSHAKLILEVMAKYHALSIALRLKKPELYNTKIRPYFHKFNMNTGIGEEGKKDLDDQVIQDMLVATNGDPNLMERLKECMRLNEEYMNAVDPIDGKYTTLTHCDLWINNLMVLYDENGLPQKVKIVDFQIAQYGSLVHDLVFFLLSSVSSNVLEEHYNDLLQVYFKTFLQCLQSVGLDTAEYTYDSFLDEIIRVAPTEIHHAIFMTKVILAENSSIPDDFKDVNFDIFKKQVGPSAITNRIGDIIRLSQKFKFL